MLGEWAVPVIASILILSIFGFFEYSNAQIQIAKLTASDAGWWADGLISDDEFVNGIKYLVERGIIGV